ncbi:phosphatidylinositol-specific phospholipase C [Kitasatospora sp. NPDC085879]|uniref:phosphatidylinositol-specific phospholipase C n=1 Tax=Kitasatospora sp. NPDC085879 TaxID=3154769 RepID=UPI00342DAD69
MTVLRDGGLLIRSTSARRIAALLLPLLLLATVVFVVAPAHEAVAAPARYYKSMADTQRPDWMGWVGDGTSLARLSIPGTHDTLAIHGGDLAVTQEDHGDGAATLQAQLMSGIRAIDIRVHAIGGKFTVHHGAIYQNANFDDVLTVLRDFLAAHPAETVLLNLKTECTGSLGSCTDDPPYDTFEAKKAILESYFAQYAGVFWQPSVAGTGPADVPTLGQVRGKVVLTRYNEQDTYGLKDMFDRAPSDYDAAYDGVRYYQDDYVVSSLDAISGKWDKVRRHLEATDKGAADKVYVNYLSGSSMLAYPYSVAGGTLGYRGVNEFALDHLFTQAASRTGVMFMDFPGPGLIGSIVARDYALAAPAKAQQAQADAALTVRDLANSTSGTADVRNEQLRRFLDSVYPAAEWDVVVAKGDAGADLQGLGAGTVGQPTWADEYLVAAAPTTGQSDLSDADLQAAVEAAVGTGPSGDAQTRASALAGALRAAYPGRAWNVVVKRSPGGFSNWFVSGYGTMYKKTTEDWNYMVWATGGTPATVGAQIAKAPRSSTDPAYSFIAGAQDKYGSSGLGVPQSYTGGHFSPGTEFGPDGYQASFTYDNSVVIAALLAGQNRDVARAVRLGDSLLYAQDHDPKTVDGRIRASYEPNPFITRDGTPYVGGFSVYTGNMAWAGMAFCRLYAVTGDGRYREGALKAANWIQSNTADSRGVGGYTGGLVDYSGTGDEMVRKEWKATEHNIDVGAFFAMLAQVTGDGVWKSRSDNAFAFVRSMQADDGRLWTGTGNDGVTQNRDSVPEDVQVWSYLATLDPAFSRSVDWAATNLAASDGPFRGVSFAKADTSKVWFEGTAHLLAAYHVRRAPGDDARAAVLQQTLQDAQSQAPNAVGGAIVAASSDGLTTGEGDIYYAAPHTGATAWYLLAGAGANPFRL